MRPVRNSTAASIPGKSLTGEDVVIVSEPFANKHGVRAGDQIDLPLGDRSLRCGVRDVLLVTRASGYMLTDR